ncbi:MAG: 4Fe-4S dicluster domain-containing protein [candidate division KSB1 bacterium]|nr:4Fe-4S dicluster domain-containing protein [candidate division KSB1 bacterium]MDZ7334906.1 4Fe-4S dicluster domain-containing protein [candidate division KSB1 bacterium]MDZ7358730.1 4Fe-4S dicluster domain-containing protein [candidate division KSB1 bacterium]MDZ7399362.1 4Fe-4S dicluster domain-containing protein [candidate division KSB1 bacterium]
MVDEIIEVEGAVPRLEVVSHLCKGCGLCIEHCPQHVIQFTDKFNEMGYKYAAYVGEGCTGCGVCFYCCPEPGAIIVYKKVKEGKGE